MYGLVERLRALYVRVLRHLRLGCEHQRHGLLQGLALQPCLRRNRQVLDQTVLQEHLQVSEHLEPPHLCVGCGKRFGPADLLEELNARAKQTNICQLLRRLPEPILTQHIVFDLGNRQILGKN